jgi:hypothetical protein
MFKIAPCSHEAARYAVMNWHYSKRMPIGKLITYGVWENDKFIGAVIYGRGASPELGAPYGLTQLECCELVRVALTNHETSVSQIVAQTIKMLKESNPGLRLIISFADPEQSHKGTIYQAMNWIYCGTSSTSKEYLYKGKWHHSRMLRPTGFGTVPEIAKLSKEQQKQLPVKENRGKFRYIYPLDKPMRRQVTKLALPYPSAVEGSEASRDTSGIKGQVQSLPTAQIVSSK